MCIRDSLKRALAKGAKLIVADPRKIELANLADLYLPIRVGSDTALLLAMAHVISREGLIDKQFMNDRTEDPEKFLKHIEKATPEWAAEICEIAPVGQVCTHCPQKVHAESLSKPSNSVEILVLKPLFMTVIA